MQATPTPETRPKRTLLIAEHAGFCHGVKKAVNKTVAAAQNQDATQGEPKAVYVLGELIHNPQEIERLRQEGIQTVHSLDEVPPGSLCIIRTHGAPPALSQEMAARNIQPVDATCPDVLLVQNRAVQLAQEGYVVVLVGRESHPEIIGIRAHTQQVPGADVIVIESPAQIQEKIVQAGKHRKVGIVSQTTQLEGVFFETVAALAKVVKELKVFNTICPATFFRQNAALDLAQKVPVMVVIGGKNSSNTTHLADICKAQGAQTIHIETPEELDHFEPLKTATTVGITAGASTPDWLVEQVIAYLQSN
ncbi:MAG: 4-hydroxy-3-methylbut-2-enyl diphosphate reductase [Vampirovibrionales bacterium]|nr:4-hydroxy-3-methylbut-2-enyl diphosphate reductase [Vampirovibrionales bacterium]